MSSGSKHWTGGAAGDTGEVKKKTSPILHVPSPDVDEREMDDTRMDIIGAMEGNSSCSAQMTGTGTAVSSSASATASVSQS